MTDPQPLPTTNPLAQDMVELIQKLLSEGELALEKMIIAQAPIMGAPIWSSIWKAALKALVKYLLNPVASLGGRVVVDAQLWLALENAAKAQALLDGLKETGDKDAIAKASSDVDKAVSTAIHYVGSTHT